MPSPFDEQLIERYVRGPDRLSAHERTAVKAVLEQHEAAREIADLLTAFYDAFDAPAEAAPQVAALLDTLFPPARIIMLRPYRARQSTMPGRTVLAAMTTSPKRRFETVATLASAEDEVLIRVVCDRQNHLWRLYTMTREPERRAHALIAFPDLALCFVTDARGRVDFTLTEEQRDVDWASVGATLVSPLSNCEFQAYQFEPDHCAVTLASGHTLQCTFKHGVLHLDVPGSPDAEAVPSAALVQAGDHRILVNLDGGQGNARIHTMPERLRVWLYP